MCLVQFGIALQKDWNTSHFEACSLSIAKHIDSEDSLHVLSDTNIEIQHDESLVEQFFIHFAILGKEETTIQLKH